VALIVLGIAWLSGIASVALWGLAPLWSGVCLIAPAPFIWTKFGNRAAAWNLALGLAAILGAWRFEGWVNSQTPDIAHHVDREVTITGTIESEPDPGETVNSYTVRVQSVADDEGGSTPTNGSVRISLSQFTDYRPGTRVTLRGELKEAPQFDGFDYRGFLARRGIAGTMYLPRVEVLSIPPRFSVRHPLVSLRRDIADIRVTFDRSLGRSLPEPEASLAAGIAFGRDGNLDPRVYDDLRDAGLAHIVAVSGTNVTLVAAAAFFILTPRLGRRRATTCAVVVVIAYVLAAGAGPSVVRSGIMASVYLGGAALGRQRSSLTALAVAAIFMTGLSPGVAIDTGFQLSLAATAGIIVFAPWIDAGAYRAGLGQLLPRPVISVVGITLAATASTFPLIWLAFGRISIVGPFANLLVEPLFVVAFVLSVVTALAGAAWEPLGWTCGLVAYYPLAATVWVGRQSSSLPFAAVNVPGGGGDAVFWTYLGLALIGWPAHRFLAPTSRQERRPLPRTVRKALSATGFATLAAIVVPVTFLPMRGHDYIEVRILNVGQGDAILVSTPHGKHVLVDSGPSGIRLARELGAALPHWERRIDAVFLTHPQQDHVAGFPALFDRFHAGVQFDSGSTNSTEASTLFLAQSTRREVLRAGDKLEIDGVGIEVLWPPNGYETENLNDTSLVLRVSYGDVSFLLTGDFESPAQRILMGRSDVTANILKVPHHGSKTSDPAFLHAVNAEIAVISVGEGNQFGHPSAPTLSALEGTRVFRTDQDGRVTIRTDGRTFSVQTHRR
jgi:competence protein ComEC